MRITASAAYHGDELAAIDINPDRCATLARVLRRDHQGLRHGVIVGPLRGRPGGLDASGCRDLLEQLQAPLQVSLVSLRPRHLVL